MYPVAAETEPVREVATTYTDRSVVANTCDFSRRGPAPLTLHLMQMAALTAGSADGPMRLARALAGIERYRHFPFRRPATTASVLARAGGSRLLDYGGDGRAVFIVPSLVNEATILDLLPDCSLIGHLKDAGLRPLLLDWGAPGEAETGFGLAGYLRRLGDLARSARQDLGDLTLIGYCMGGTLGLAAAAARPGLFARAAFLAAPWDFHANAARHRALAGQVLPMLPALLSAPTIPPALLQSFFAGLAPEAALGKFGAFSAMAADSPEARRFVALEDWVNDGPPLARDAGLEVLRDWYANNLPGRGKWRPEGIAVRPDAIGGPVFCAVPQSDRIVPPTGALGLAAATPPCRRVRPVSGHVGMVVGARGREQLWRPLTAWLLAAGG